MGESKDARGDKSRTKESTKQHYTTAWRSPHTSMIAEIRDNRWIWISHITDAEEAVLWTEFSVSRDNVHIDPDQLGQWDGIYRKYNRAKRRLARPLLSLLRKVCQENNLPLSIKDSRPKSKIKPYNPEHIDEKFLPGITLDPHQLRWAKAVCRIECGIASVPTGGGKGEMIAATCKAVPCNTIIIADQKVVIDQLKERIELRDVAEEVGLFYAGRRPTGEAIVVGSIQSLCPPVAPDKPNRTKKDTDASWEKKLEKYESKVKAYKTRKKNAAYLQNYVKKADMIIVDECDKATSSVYKKLFRYWFKGRRRYGFSGTPMDKDKPVEAMEMQEHLGSIIVKESRRELERIGRIIPADYIMICPDALGNISDGRAYDIAYDEDVVKNPRFHKLIATICGNYLKDGDGSLILVDREHLGQKLVETFADRQIESHFIYGKTRKRRRDELLESFENRDFNVLIGGKIVNRGLDLDGGCENLIITNSSKLESEFLQKVGRALRHNKKGRSRIIDFYHRTNKYLYKHSKERLKIMVAAGYRTLVIFPGGVIDGSKLIESRFRVPKKLKTKPKSKEEQKELFEA